MYWFYRSFAHLLNALSDRGLRRAGSALGWVWFVIIPVRRAEILANLGRAFPEQTARERRRLCLEVMQVLCGHFLETATLLVVSDEKLKAKIEWEGYEHIEKARADGGVLILATHVDNWELLIQGFGVAGIGLNAAVRMPTSEGVSRGLLEIRKRALFHGVEPRGSIRKLVELLGENKCVTVVMDQAQSRRRGIFVPFFGEPAMTTPGLAILALKSNRPVIPVIPRRVAPGQIKLQAGPPIPIDDLKGDPDFVAKATARFTAVVEGHIRKNPARWLWAHRRFKVEFGPDDECAERAAVKVHDDGSVTLEGRG